MLINNLRHLRVFLAIAACHSVSGAAVACRVTQPAATQALAKLEAAAGTTLFARTPQGLYLSPAGECLHHRVKRAFGRLDDALSVVSDRLMLTVTRAQLTALIAVVEAQNVTLAAARLGLAQPTVHRAIAQIERSAERVLFQRSAIGVTPGRASVQLARAARLAFIELEQAVAELAEFQGREVGSIIIGATPLARSHVLPPALDRFRLARPKVGIQVIDGPYTDLLAGLRRGEIDVIIGALRYPSPVDDIVQEHLFNDELTVFAANDDPLVGRDRVPLPELRLRPWLVPRIGTPARAQFAKMFTDGGVTPPESLIETGSVILMREMVGKGGHLACLSRAQASREIRRQLVTELNVPGPQTPRPIGLTYRRDWSPTPSQALLLEEVRRFDRDE